MKYRIVTDHYAGYEVQIKYPWWPWWIQVNGVNTWGTVDQARNYIQLLKSKQHKSRVVEVIED